MAKNQEQSALREGLLEKLKVIQDLLDTLSPSERNALVENPNLLRQVFGSPRRSDLTGLDQKVRDRIAEVDAVDPKPVPIVQVTKEQQEEAKRLHMEIWKKLGIADEMIKLSELRGERIDTIAKEDEDPELNSEKEE